MLTSLELFITPTEKPDKSLDVKAAAQPSSSSSSTAEQERQSVKKQEEKQETAAVEPPKAKEARRFVFYQCSDGIFRVILLIHCVAFKNRNVCCRPTGSTFIKH